MKEIDALLSMIENPTRRRILEALVREPHYPFQLARELRVSQPAIVKHLRVLEDGGLVYSREEQSDRGPARRVYRPKGGFAVLVELRDGVFNARLMPADEGEDEGAPSGDASLQEAREEMRRMDVEIAEMEKAWSQMMERRGQMTSRMLSRLQGEDGAYRHRLLLHRLLSHPQDDLEQLSRSLEMRMEECENLFRDLERMVDGEGSGD